MASKNQNIINSKIKKGVEIMRKKTGIRKALAVLLCIIMTAGIAGCGGNREEETKKDNNKDNDKENNISVELPELQSWNNVTVKNSKGADGDAVLIDEGISIVYDKTLGKNVLKLDKGTGYLKLPQDIWKDAEGGFTVSFKVKPDSDTDSDSRIFQTNLCGYGVGDTVWHDAPEISITPGGSIRVYVGGRTINGTYSPNATYNNGGSGDNKSYAEPGGHKTRYNGAVNALSSEKWTEITISVSSSEFNVYIDGKKADIKVNEADEGDIASTLEYLFGAYEGGERILKQYVNSSIGNSVYSDTKNYKGLVGDITIYKEALSEKEAASLPDNAEYSWDFDTKDLVYEETGKEQASDLTKYMGEVSLEEVSVLKTQSPDGKNVVRIWKDEKGAFYYSITAGDTVISESAAIGMELENGKLREGLRLDENNVSVKAVNETYDIITGANAKADNNCNETRFTLKNDSGSFDFVVRAFDDGVSYKYENVSVGTGEKVTVLNELSEIIMPVSTAVWSFNLNATYEGEYVKRTGNQMEALNALLSTPMLANQGNYWMLITEANVFNNNGDFCSSALKTESGKRNLNWSFGLDRDPNKEAAGELDSPGHINITKVETRNGFATPWRVVVISDNLEKFCESAIIANLNPEADKELFGDTSWIKPGKVAWSWWSEDAEQGNYDKHVEYIDFAAENGWEYVCMDAYWRKFEDRLPEICAYAKEKGVGVFVWVNYRDIKNYDDMDALFSKWKEAGVAGLKTDYFESDSQDVLNVMEQAAICSAKHQLMILYHGCVRPGGEYRTYPNILSTEAVQGEEWHKWNAYPTVENCLLYPFSRNICGSMDYTPVATKVGSNESTYGFGIAMPVVYESGLQHLAYAASSYKSYNGLSFLNNLAVTWDESKLIEGYPGEYVTYARRNKDNWYIGAMTKEKRTAEIKLDFLGDGEYNAYIYKDNEDGTQLVIEKKKVTGNDTLSFDLLDAGGVAAIITRNEIDTDVAESENMNNPNYTYYEAEGRDNTLSGAAVLQSSAFCSGSQKVGYVGNGTNNTLTFNKIRADKDGVYKLLLYYCCGEDRKVVLTVNGDKSYEMTGLNSGDYVHTSVKEIEIELKAGENTIKLSNDTYFAPDIDRIAISKE